MRIQITTVLAVAAFTMLMHDAQPARANHLSRCNVGQAWHPWPQYRRNPREVRVEHIAPRLLFGLPGHFSHQSMRCRRRA